MPEFSTKHALLKDPLSEITRKERRNLLATSALGIIVIKTGLLPTKIAALGIEFSQTDRATLLKCLAAIIIYFLIAFIVYALSDLWTGNISLFQTGINELREGHAKALAFHEQFNAYIQQLDESQARRQKDYDALAGTLEETRTRLDNLMGQAETVSTLPAGVREEVIKLGKTLDEHKAQLTRLHEQSTSAEYMLDRYKGLVGAAKLESKIAEGFTFRTTEKISYLRYLFEYALPFALAIYAIVILLRG